MDFLEYLKLTEGLNQWQTKPLFGLDSIYFADGPHGLRKQLLIDDSFGNSSSYVATAFPTASLTSCSFDKNLLHLMGASLAEEAKALNVHVILGPGVNIKRNPLCGRNFEYFSEDPLLAGELGRAFVDGVQSNGVGVSVKHFFANNQENYRYTMNSVIDKRAMREIYLKPFEIIVKSNPATIMTSYNQVNGTYVNEHPLLRQIVRNEWNYNGLLISDWGAINDKKQSILASHDLEMPSSREYNNQSVIPFLNEEKIQNNLIETKHRLEQLIKTYKKDYVMKVDFNKQHEIAKTIARESLVLLKNEAVLPLNKNEKILITGPFIDKFRYQGAGSSEINPYHVEEVIEIAPKYSDNIIISKGIGFNNQDDNILNEALFIAKDCDKIIVFAGLPQEYEAEGFDRENISIPNNQIEYLKKLFEVNPNIIVVLLGGGVMDLSFDHQTKGLMLASLSGEAGVSAIMDVLYGENPSGRLSETYPMSLNDCNIKPPHKDINVYYDESIFVGYRYYDTFNVPIRYPFGFGLSYADFQYNNLKLSVNNQELTISFDLTNASQIKAKEVIQMYVGAPSSSVYKPKKELRLFDKVLLKPQETINLSYNISLDDLRYFDIYKDSYVLEQGNYHIYISKNVSLHVLEDTVFISGDDVNHPATSYLSKTYDTSDFNLIYQDDLLEKRPKLTRPYSLNSTLEDLENTFIGRLLSKKIIKIALKETKDMSPTVQILTKRMLKTSPLRILANYGGDAFTFNTATGIIDVANLKFI